MHQFNKVMKVCQYIVGFLGIFEIFQFSSVMRQLKLISILYYLLNKIPWVLINFPFNSLPKLITGLIAISRVKITSDELMHSVLFPYLISSVREIENEAEETWSAKTFHWLAAHPLKDSTRRNIVFLSFIILSLADLITS
jgi:hypothetical protein